MSNSTEQMKVWQGQFGKDYTDRTSRSVEETELIWKEHFGITRTEANKEFLDGINRGARVLEVGCNTGNQLLCLQEMGFKNLYGIEIQSYAIKLFKARTEGINVVQASAFDIPFKDSSFDLVFTSGVLIHIAPEDIDKVLAEIYRCSNRYIWGWEFFAKAYTEISYRGHQRLLWRADFVKLLKTQFPNLKLAKEKRSKHLQIGEISSMFLLEKNQEGGEIASGTSSRELP